jgi:hypothetical protein
MHRRLKNLADVSRGLCIYVLVCGILGKTFWFAVSSDKTMIPFSNLSIAGLWRPGDRHPDGSGTTEVWSWDFVVDGTSLRTRWQDRDIAGVLGWGRADVQRGSVAKLLRDAEPDFPPNRVAIFVCPECGDLGCGAVTVAVQRDVSAITWSDFRWEVNYYSDHPNEFTQYFELGPFRFEPGQYREVLNRALVVRPNSLPSSHN